MDDHRAQQQAQAGPDHMESPALPPKPLNLCRLPTPGDGCAEPGIAGVDGRTPASRRSTEYSRSSALVKASQGWSASTSRLKSIPLPTRVARHPEEGTTPESHTMEEQEGGGSQFGLDRPVLVVAEVLRLDHGRAPLEAGDQCAEQAWVGNGVGVDHREGGEARVAFEQAVHGPAQRRTLAPGVRSGFAHQHRRPRPPGRAAVSSVQLSAITTMS